MKKTAKEKLRLGIFVILGLLVFVVGAYFIGERQNMFSSNIEISSQFDDVNGLQKGNNVRYSGINVGVVNTITMINDSVIKVDLLIEENMIQHIKKDAIATIGTDGLVGNMIVNIIPGKGDELAIKEGDYIQSYTKIRTDDMLNTLSVTNKNAALLTEDLLKITNAINSGKGTLGMLISDSIASNDIKLIITNLKQTSIETSKTIRSLNKVIAAIDLDKSVAGVLLNDSIEGKKVKVIIANLEATSKSLTETIDNLNKTITNVKSGDGAINYLSNDKEFVKNLDQTIKNLNEGTEKFDQSMEALKNNFLLRGYFRKLERKKEKEQKKEVE